MLGWVGGVEAVSGRRPGPSAGVQTCPVLPISPCPDALLRGGAAAVDARWQPEDK